MLQDAGAFLSASYIATVESVYSDEGALETVGMKHTAVRIYSSIFGHHIIHRA